MTSELIERTVEGLIYLVRGERVILDQDLAQLYGVGTKVLVQAVQRNRKRFPDDFMFQLSVQEFSALRSQIVTSKGRGGRRTPPYAFTEHGVAMLSSVLHTERAVEVNIQIVRTFIRLRRIIESYAELAEKLKDLEEKHDAQFRVVFDAIRQIMGGTKIPPKRQIGFGRDTDGET